jgi:hypothetical protein
VLFHTSNSTAAPTFAGRSKDQSEIRSAEIKKVHSSWNGGGHSSRATSEFSPQCFSAGKRIIEGGGLWQGQHKKEPDNSNTQKTQPALESTEQQ